MARVRPVPVRGKVGPEGDARVEGPPEEGSFCLRLGRDNRERRETFSAVGGAPGAGSPGSVRGMGVSATVATGAEGCSEGATGARGSVATPTTAGPPGPRRPTGPHSRRRRPPSTRPGPVVGVPQGPDASGEDRGFPPPFDFPARFRGP